jgi:hypothetical protein
MALVLAGCSGDEGAVTGEEGTQGSTAETGADEPDATAGEEETDATGGSAGDGDAVSLDDLREAAVRMSVCTGTSVNDAWWTALTTRTSGDAATVAAQLTETTCILAEASCEAVLTCMGYDVSRPCNHYDGWPRCDDEARLAECGLLDDCAGWARQTSCADGPDGNGLCMAEEDGSDAACYSGTCEGDYRVCEEGVQLSCRDGMLTRVDCALRGQSCPCECPPLASSPVSFPDEPTCGDNICQSWGSSAETLETCPTDCSVCGDDICTTGDGETIENETNCPVDCVVCPTGERGGCEGGCYAESRLGDGQCEPGLNCHFLDKDGGDCWLECSDDGDDGCDRDRCEGSEWIRCDGGGWEGSGDPLPGVDCGILGDEYVCAEDAQGASCRVLSNPDCEDGDTLCVEGTARLCIGGRWLTFDCGGFLGSQCVIGESGDRSLGHASPFDDATSTILTTARCIEETWWNVLDALDGQEGNLGEEDCRRVR